MRTQYRQMRRSSLASLLTVIFMIQVVCIGSPAPGLVPCGVAYAAWFAGQEVLIRLFDRARPADAAIAPWRRAAAAWLATSGAIWGAGFYLFITPGDLVTASLLICAMAALTSGSIGFRSTILPGFYAFNVLVAVPMAVRLLAIGGAAYTLLGSSVLVYALVIIGYGRAQHALISESLRLRFRSDALVDALRDQTLAAEAARRDAERASLAKSQFLAAASHDLRQPLYALGLFSASLREMRMDEPARAIVDDIQDSVAAMETLFAGLLDISRLEAGVVEPSLGPVGVDALFDRLSQYFRPIAVDRGIDLRFRSDGEWVRSDPVLLEQVLGNLVANALRWTSRGGVLVAARRRPGALSLEVWDTGIGISRADQARIFDDFVQLDNAGRDRRRGLGLGLAIARRSARLIGSDIAVASRPGVGSRFAIVQPVASRGADLPDGPTALPAVPRDPRLPILIVEDDRTVQAALGGLLRRWGLDVVIVEGGAAALDAVAGGTAFGLVICDFRLGAGGSGLDVIRRIAAIHRPPAPPAILITGDGDPEIASAARTAGVALLHKPVRPDKLAAILGAAPPDAAAAA